MEILPLAYYENLKRYWRRRKYQRLNSSTHNKKKLKISRLGGARSTSTRRLWRIRGTPKLHCKLVSEPIKLLAKFHDAYVDMMIGMAKKAANPINNGVLFGGKRVTKARHVALVSFGEEVVDSRLVMEIYKKIAASQQSNGEL